jgi:hypothetical protein
MKREILKDPFDERLKSIVKDSLVKGGLPAWIMRTYNINTDQVDPKTGNITVNNGTIVLKSMWWPGAFTFYNSQRTQQLYVGSGLKNQPYECKFFPVNPPVMKKDRKKEKPLFMDLQGPAKLPGVQE